MGRRRLDETPTGRWSIRVGAYPAVVRCRERERGGVVRLFFTDPTSGSSRAVTSREPTVRDRHGRVDTVAAKRVEAEALALVERLKINRLERAIEPHRLTLAQGYARFRDERTGGLPRSKPARVHHRAAERFWLLQLDADLPWDRVQPAAVEAAARRLVAVGKVPTAEKYVRCLRTVARWLRDRAGFDGLKDPTRGCDLKALRESYQPRRPRYHADELRALLAVAYQVDPRFAFALIWADDSGVRSAGLYRLMRSAVDAPLDIEPRPGQAPYGWVLYPPLKGQRPALSYLTERQRQAFRDATERRWNGARWEAGYLSALEARWLADRVDYPLIPGGRFPRSGVFPAGVRAVSNNALINWLLQAEQKAGVRHVPARGWHGIRRSWADHTVAETDMDTVTVAGGWGDRDMPEQVYIERQRHDRLAASREAQEGKHR